MQRLPDFLKRQLIDTDKTKKVRHILKEKHLNTVCEGARCPNKNECYQCNTATFLIMGNVCTRNCRYCNISSAKPLPVDNSEPAHLAEAIKDLALDYVVITSVTRDDLDDGGASHFSKCINEIRKLSPNTKIEILTPDFKQRFSDCGKNNTYNKSALDTIIDSNPDVFNHNIEVVSGIFKTARPQGDYKLSLSVLEYVKTHSNITTKSGLMIGLGETKEQIKNTLFDLKSVGCDILTIGQYIAPSKNHLPVSKYYSLDEYSDLINMAKEIGFKKYQIGPLVRSSYHAKNIFENK